MTRVRSAVTIARPREDVFDFVTTPANWPRWHPSSVEVTGDAAHSLDVGERCTERYVVAGRAGVTDWTVLHRLRPATWVIEARPAAGGHALITYELLDAAGGTRFTRTLDYEMPNALLALLDRLYLSRRIERESERALANLRTLLESRAPAA